MLLSLPVYEQDMDNVKWIKQKFYFSSTYYVYLNQW